MKPILSPYLNFNGKTGEAMKFYQSVLGGELELLTKYFNGLSVGGKVDIPLAKQFWGDTFGMLTDKYGVHWMVNVTAQK